MKTQHSQSTRSSISFEEIVSLPVLAGTSSIDRNTRLIPTLMSTKNAVLTGYQLDGGQYFAVVCQFLDPVTGLITDSEVLDLTLTATDPVTIDAAAVAAINAYATSVGYTLATFNRQFPVNVPVASSYQTIVTQTGTTAPAVSGSLTPSSTYPSGTTFTWARTSAGVYTLTASTAVFNTSGKTAVFVGPLNNLNGAFTAVVTSSTVITLTTAVQSLAVLGLLGFTAAPTDALLSKTMVYIQTYA